MSGRVLPFGTPHEEAQRLLPWLASGRLDAGDAAWLRAHVDACDACRADLAGLHVLARHCRDAPHPVPEADAGWRRVQARLGAQRARPRADVAAWWHARRWPAWVLAPAALAAVLVVLPWMRPGPRADLPGTAYHTLAATPPSMARLLVVFDGRIPEARLRRLLQASGARIVDGPNAAGAYTLAVPVARAGGVRDALRTSPGVLLVERLDPVPPR